MLGEIEPNLDEALDSTISDDVMDFYDGYCRNCDVLRLILDASEGPVLHYRLAHLPILPSSSIASYSLTIVTEPE